MAGVERLRIQPLAGVRVDQDGRHRLRFAARHAAVRVRRGEIHRLRAAGSGQPQRSQRLMHARRLQRLLWRQQPGLPLQRRQVRQPLGFGELGVAHIHHDHAGDKPAHKQPAQGNAQPAVNEERPAFGVKVHEGLGRRYSETPFHADFIAARRRQHGLCSAVVHGVGIQGVGGVAHAKGDFGLRASLPGG